MKKDKKTEVDPENLDPKNQKKKINLSTMAPALSALLVVACAGASVADLLTKSICGTETISKDRER